MNTRKSGSAETKSAGTDAQIQHTSGSKYMLVTGQKTLAELRSIVKNYVGDPTVPPVRLFGLPGAGKTTLLNMMSAQLKLEGADGDDLAALSYFFDDEELDGSDTLDDLVRAGMKLDKEFWQKVHLHFQAVDNAVTRFAKRVPLATQVHAHKVDEPIYIMLHPYHVYYVLHLSKRNETLARLSHGRPTQILSRREHLIKNREMYTDIVRQWPDLDHVMYDYSPQAIRSILAFVRMRFESTSTVKPSPKG